MPMPVFSNFQHASSYRKGICSIKDNDSRSGSKTCRQPNNNTLYGSGRSSSFNFNMLYFDTLLFLQLISILLSNTLLKIFIITSQKNILSCITKCQTKCNTIIYKHFYSFIKTRSSCDNIIK